ncbi:hypothetical protein [Coxiella endosymbiont of Rhipicephalus microplus]|uniref:hypothetical protein n=1 Tax=Coxiella endosymbiont of Rhipicephalus microplus TaxID=1656186 RepID=UPI000CE5ADE6|nr:hypothetical protein [Coxiella endosymbiont of Rhipicephalus microplus]
MAVQAREHLELNQLQFQRNLKTLKQGSMMKATFLERNKVAVEKSRSPQAFFLFYKTTHSKKTN